MSDDNVIPLFNDRRIKPELPMLHPKPRTHRDLHEHLREEHGWGGPKSEAKHKLEPFHESTHREGYFLHEDLRHEHE